MQHNDILTIQEIQNMEQNSAEMEVVDEPEAEYNDEPHYGIVDWDAYNQAVGWNP